MMETRSRSRSRQARQADLNSKLITASMFGTSEEVEELIKEGAIVSATGSLRILSNVVMFNQPVKMINALLRGGAKINGSLKTGATTLHYAVSFEMPHIAKRLVQHGANVDAFDAVQGTPLHVAVTLAKVGMARLLLKAGANVEGIVGIPSHPVQGTPLRVAVSKDNVEIVKLLLEAGANVDGIVGIPSHPVQMGLTNLHLAVQRNNLSSAELLVGAGANLEALDAQGETPLCMAVEQGNAEMVSLLLHNGARVDGEVLRYHPEQLLVTAVVVRNVGILKQLIAAGAPVRAPDRRGVNYHTPLHIAVNALRAPNVEMAKVLIRAGAPLDALDESGFTPLMRSLWSGHISASIALIEAGALGCEVTKGAFRARMAKARTGLIKRQLLGALLIGASACRGEPRAHTACTSVSVSVGRVGARHGVWSEAMQERAGSSTRALAAGARWMMMAGGRKQLQGGGTGRAAPADGGTGAGAGRANGGKEGRRGRKRTRD